MNYRLFRAVLAGLVIVLAAQPVVAQDEGESSDRAFLQYEVQKVDPWGPFALNLLLGLGIGSFIQGDTAGGLIVAAGEVVGLSLLVGGYVTYYRHLQEPAYGDAPSSSYVMMVGGAVLYGAARVAGLVFPFTYADSFNKKLRQDLGIDVSVMPGDGVAITIGVDT